MNNNMIVRWNKMKLVHKSFFVIVVLISYSLLVFLTKCNLIVIFTLLGVIIVMILGIVYSENMKKIKPISNNSNEMIITLATIIKNETDDLMLTNSNNIDKFHNIIESVTLLEIINSNSGSNIYFNRISTNDFFSQLAIRTNRQLFYNICSPAYFMEFRCNKLLLEQSILQICNNQTNGLSYILITCEYTKELCFTIHNSSMDDSFEIYKLIGGVITNCEDDIKLTYDYEIFKLHKPEIKKTNVLIIDSFKVRGFCFCSNLRNYISNVVHLEKISNYETNSIYDYVIYFDDNTDYIPQSIKQLTEGIILVSRERIFINNVRIRQSFRDLSIKNLLDFIEDELFLCGSLSVSHSTNTQDDNLITKHSMSSLYLLSSKTILIADDQVINRTILYNAIKMLKNANIISASNGSEALDITLCNRVDLIFMDINMPIMNGTDSAKLIKQKYNNIIIIAHSTTYIAIDDSPFDDILSKPFNSNELRRILEKYF